MNRASIQDLIHKRNALRKQGLYKEADAIRRHLLDHGVRLQDTETGPSIIPKSQTSTVASRHFLTLFGSGEISPTGRKIHEYVFRNSGKKKHHIRIISTPAGFQPNVSVVMDEIFGFFRKSLQFYIETVAVIDARTRQQANDAAVIGDLGVADYIFMGPGSPTYAVRHLSDTLLLKTIIRRAKSGASLALSSAAVLACSEYSLPVYEIFKVGEDLHWKQGLNVYAALGKRMTVIPHFDNSEGGGKTDTSRCYMGSERFGRLLTLLPSDAPVLGLDEQTGHILDLDSLDSVEIGIGGIHPIIISQ
jgi:cyanophycinase-like exopeptidase